MNEYQKRLIDFSPKENKDCPNYVEAIKLAKKHGYKFSEDTSYNGFIFFEKEVEVSDESPLDSYRIRLQVYDELIRKKIHGLEYAEKEADFGQSILSETTYYFRTKTYENANDVKSLFKLAKSFEKKTEKRFSKVVAKLIKK